MAEPQKMVTATTLSPSASEPTPPTKPLPSYRLPDTRPRHNRDALKAMGIETYESQRLILHTDVPSAQLDGLGTLSEALYTTLTERFGQLPEATDGSDYQLTGYLLRDEERFRKAGLIPEELPAILHGRHRAYEFWLRDQPTDYYRMHLLLHEMVHCFTTARPDVDLPLWYLEGMAEYFATHRWSDSPTPQPQFGIMPEDREEVPGWGRIKLIREAVAERRTKPLAKVLSLPGRDFFENDAYAWSWGAFLFFSETPRYRDRFYQLVDDWRGGNFYEAFLKEFGPEEAMIAIAWEAFVRQLDYGYDLSASNWPPQWPEPPEQPTETSVDASKGWQTTGIRVRQNERWNFSAEGEIELAKTTRAWVSQPKGISFDYFDGIPLGKLTVWICPDMPTSEWEQGPLKIIPIGSDDEVTIPYNGRLCFRVNDRWNSLGNNRGAYRVWWKRMASQ